MRPLRLVLHAFGPYPGTVAVDFERLAAHGLFLIHGPTGSGKSTVLDAMTYALFGDDKDGPERAGREFASAHAPLARTRVELLFSVGGERYRVVRYPAQRVARARGSGSKDVEKPSEARLERLADDDTVIETVAEKAQEVGRAVQERLGCTVAQFRQTVVLPQGAFREVVTDEKARRVVLERLFDTRRFARLTARLKATAARIQAEADLERRHHDDLLARAGVTRPDELRALRAAALAARDAAAARTTERERERAARTDALLRGEAHAARFTRLDELQARLLELDGAEAGVAATAARPDLAPPAPQLGPAAGRLRGARADAATAVARRDEAAAAAAAARTRQDAAAAALATQEARDDERGAARTLAQRLADLAPEVGRLAQQRADQADHAARAAELATAASTHATARQAADAERTRLERERADLRRVASGLDEARARRDAAGERSHAGAAVAALAERIAAAARALAALDDTTGADLLDLLRGHAAGLAAATLADGEPCPVCGSVHHPRPHPGTDVEELGDALERYREREAARAAEHERARTAEAERRALLDRLGWPSTPPPAAELAAALGAAEAEVLAAQAARERLVAVDDRLDALQREAADQADRASAAELAAERERHEADALGRDVARTLAALPTDAHDPAAFAERLARARAHEAELAAALAGARAAAGAAAAELATADARQQERHDQALRAQAEARAAAASFDEGLHAAGFTDEPAYAAARLEDAEAARLRAEVDAHRDARVATGAQVAALREELAQLERPDLAVLRVAADAAEAAWREADAEAHDAQRRLDLLADAVADLERADERHRALQDRHAAATRLAQVASGSVKGRPKVDLETFVLQRRFLDVLQLGNLHLRDMTGGRYSLHLVRDSGRASDTGLDLEVADHHVDGARRPARTLSGGEGFLAALALALGLSDVAQRARHPIEALFIDEGFGSLDRDTLDLVTHTLRTLPRVAGRIVGIVSHVEDLRRLIPVQLVVTPGAHGSELRVEVNA